MTGPCCTMNRMGTHWCAIVVLYCCVFAFCLGCIAWCIGHGTYR